MSADKTLLGALRDALNHLYDPDRLHASPLFQLLALPVSVNSIHKQQQVLLEAIEALRPPPGEPATSGKRRTYQILQLRYTQQFAQKEVAIQLGLSVRQYRRLQQAALQALAYQLQEQYGAPSSSISSVEFGELTMSPLPATLRWMAELVPDEPTNVIPTLSEVIRLVQPLAQRHRKELRVEGEVNALAAIHPLVFRQALLQLLNTAILQAGNDDIVVRLTTDPDRVTIAVVAPHTDAPGETPAGIQPGDLEILCQMLAFAGGELELSSTAHMYIATVRCRVTPQCTILAIDDHEDTLDLLQRYVASTRFRLVTCQNPHQAIDLAVAHQPGVILLDVMMPAIDGWEVLTRLKQEATTAHLPILVCTVLDQSELALSLGAADFLRKPFTRQALLALLDAQARAPAPAPP